MIKKLTWKMHQKLHRALVEHLINMSDIHTGTPPSKERMVSDGIVASIEEAKMVKDTWTHTDIDAAVEKAIFLKYFGKSIIFENGNGDLGRMMSKTKKNGKHEWTDFFSTMSNRTTSS